MEKERIYEKAIEHVLYACRWLLLPIFFGLAFLVILLTVEFYTVLYDTTVNVIDLDKKQLIVVVLTLVDMALISSLIVMVAISGYENFVSKINMGMHDKPTIFSRLDPGTIKIKLAMVIIAISSIQLLQTMTDVSSYSPEEVAMQISLHVGVIVAGIAIGFIDKLLTAKHNITDSVIDKSKKDD